MRTEWASQSLGVQLEGKSVLADILGIRPYAPNLRSRSDDQWVAGRQHPTDHRFGQTDATILGRLIEDEIPEAGNILLQVPEHEIRTVAPEIALARIILSQRQDVLRVKYRIEQGPLCVEAILVLVSEQKLARRNQIAVAEVRTGSGLSPRVPIDLRLAYAIDESKRLPS